ncbi:hypothetical protein ACJX0J_011784, partial [Zea mays]
VSTLKLPLYFYLAFMELICVLFTCQLISIYISTSYTCITLLQTQGGFWGCARFSTTTDPPFLPVFSFFIVFGHTIFPSAADGHAIFSETWDMRTIGDRNKEEKSKEGNGQDNVNIGVELGMFWIMILNNLCGEIMEEFKMKGVFWNCDGNSTLNLFGIFLLRNKEDGIHRMGTEYGGNTAIERWQGWAKNTSGSNKKEKKEIIQKLDLLDKRAETCMLSTQEVDMLASMLREEEVKKKLSGVVRMIKFAGRLAKREGQISGVLLNEEGIFALLQMERLKFWEDNTNTRPIITYLQWLAGNLFPII